jgi:predicted Zn-dependent protease with MMP-like domain
MSAEAWPARDRERFDALVGEVIDALPAALRELIDEVPIVVLDVPTPEMLRDLGLAPDDAEVLDELCGLHSGHMLTERSIEAPEHEPETIHLFRRGISALAGGWDEHQEHDDQGPLMVGGTDAIREEIRITLLHELGHHFGLDEDELGRLGYD